MVATFVVHLTDSDQKLSEEFRRFVERQGLGAEEASKVASQFGLSALPQIGRFRGLADSGSNVNFERTFDTSAGQIKVTLDTSPKSLFSRIGALFGR